MKLFRITSLIQFLFTGLMLILAGVLIFRLITTINDTETQEKLLVNKERIVKQLEKGQTISELKPILEIEELNSNPKPATRITTKWIYDPIEEEKEQFMEVSSIEKIHGKSYRIIFRQVKLESHDFSNSIIEALIIVFSILLAGLLLFNYILSHLTWRSFNQNIKLLNAFSLERNEPIALRKSGIKEFRELNSVITKLTERVQQDYLSVKEFSEYASHEIQTPLAIIRAKQEELLQDKQLTERNALLIKNTLNAVYRLSKLNQALLLITKIENHQFHDDSEINLSELIEQTLNQMTDLIAIRNLKIEKSLTRIPVVLANRLLTDILISNLINNAIKHNIENGTIRIEGADNKLIISNTGNIVNVTPEKLFDRFSKADLSSNSLGLGLSIAKRICQVYNWEIHYAVDKNQHILTIKF